MKKPKLIIIMGQPGTGKTTLAYKLADNFNIDLVLSTDILRTILKSIDTNPILHTVTHEAWRMYGEKTKENIYKGYYEHCLSLYSSVKYVIQKALEEGRNLIIEGAHILPFNYDLLDLSGFDIYPIYLQVKGKENLLERFKSKNKYRLKKYGGWKENYEIIRYIEKINLSKDNKNYLIIDTDLKTKEEVFRNCLEVIK